MEQKKATGNISDLKKFAKELEDLKTSLFNAACEKIQKEKKKYDAEESK